MTGSLEVRWVLGEMIAAYRKRWPLLLGVGLVVFVPVGLREALENPLEDVDADGPTSPPPWRAARCWLRNRPLR